MKRTILSLIILVMCQPPAHAATYDVVIKIIAGAALVFSAANSAEAATIHNQEADVISDLKQHNLSSHDGAIFQIYFAVDPRAAHRWFLSPNVYALVQIEGQGDFIPASVAKGYRGQELSLTVYGRDIVRVAASLFTSSTTRSFGTRLGIPPFRRRYLSM